MALRPPLRSATEQERRSVVLAAEARRWQAAAASRVAHRRRYVRTESGATASVTSSAVMLQKDILNIVGSAPGGGTEVQFVRDADGGLRAYIP